MRSSSSPAPPTCSAFAVSFAGRDREVADTNAGASGAVARASSIAIGSPLSTVGTSPVLADAMTVASSVLYCACTLRLMRTGVSWRRTHLAEGVLGTCLDLERVPHLPELGLRFRVAELARVCVDRTRTVDLAELALHAREALPDPRRLSIGQRLERRLVDGARRGEAVVRRGLGEVEEIHLVAVARRHRARRALIDRHRLAQQPMLFLKLPVLQIDQLAKLGRALVERLLKQVARPLQARATLCEFSRTYVALHKLAEVHIPQLKRDRVRKYLDAALVHLERLFVVLLVLEEHRIVNDRLCIRDLQLHDPVKRLLRALERAKALLEIGVQAPEPKTLEQPALRRQGIIVVGDRLDLVLPTRATCSTRQHTQRLVVVPVPHLHLGPAAPHLGEVVYAPERHLHGTL